MYFPFYNFIRWLTHQFASKNILYQRFKLSLQSLLQGFGLLFPSWTSLTGYSDENSEIKLASIKFLMTSSTTSKDINTLKRKSSKTKPPISSDL